MGTTVRAQYQIKSWTTDDGLPQNTVRSILQTPDGYLWMTTLDGLARFDGVKFTVFNKLNAPGFGANRLNQLIQSPNGDLWISAESDLVMRYQAGKFTTYALGESRTQNNLVRSLVLDDLGNPVAFSTNGIFRWNGDSFVHAMPIAGETNKSSVLWSKSGAFWYFHENTLHRFKDGKISEYRLLGDSNKRLDDIVKLFEDKRGRLWCGTYAGLFVLENEQIKNYTTADGLPDNEVKPSVEDSSGNVWAVTPKGAVIIAPDGKISTITTKQKLSDDSTATVFQDREGSIWIGTFHRGINRLTKQIIQFYSIEDGLAASVVHPIYQLSNGDILLGGGGLTRYRNGVFSPFLVDGKKYNFAVTAIGEERDGRLWLGDWQETYYIENGSQKSLLDDSMESATVVDIYEQKNNTLWFGTDQGLFRRQNNVLTHLTIADGLVSDNVKVIHESGDGTFWFGTYGGLSEYRNGVFTNFTTADGLASNQVRSLYEDAHGTLWIGSYDGGLTRLKEGMFTAYTSNDGLFNDGVFQILEDGSGNLWMSSNRGIYRVAKQQLNDFAEGKINYIESIAYGKSDGLLETECNGGQQPAGIKARDGKLWFPTQGGVAVIEPEKIKTNPLAPSVVIESALIDGQTTSLNDGIEIALGKNNLEIIYTGLSFVKPELVRFKYKLVGQDPDWVEAGTRRTAYYSYLPPGDYVFTVLAANSDGVWNTEGKSIRVRVVPHFYQTKWFLTLSVLGFFGIFLGGYRIRLRQIEKKHHQQEIFSRKLIDSQEQERKRIAVELHDSLGQQLLVIKNWAMMEIMAKGEDNQSREALGEISDTASEAIEEVREIIYDLRPYQLDKIGLRKTLLFMIEKIAAATNIQFTTEIGEIDNLFDYDSEIVLYRIVQEGLNNIVKHSQATAAAVIIEQSAHALNLRIEDDGGGFTLDSDTESESVGFGLTGIGERVRMLRGNRTITTAPGGGTKIFISIPVGKNK